jgi:hypothetical protein
MPRIDPTISAGNLLSIATIIVAVGIAWGQLRSEQVYQQDQINDMKRAREIRIAATDQHFQTLDAAVAALSIQTARTDTSLGDIRAGIARIEAKLNKLEERP